MTFQDNSETVNKINKHGCVLQPPKEGFRGNTFFTSFFISVPMIFNPICTEQWLLLLMIMFYWIQEATSEIRGQLYIYEIAFGLEKDQDYT